VGTRKLPHAAVLLAGGRSTRFGGDKLLARLGGAPLLAHSVRGALALFREVFLVAKESGRYRGVLEAEGLGDLLDRDRVLHLRRDLSRRRTPLAGLQAGLTHARSEACFVAGADMPFAADRKLLRALEAALAGHDAAAPRFAGSEQPLCALVRRRPCLEAANALLTRRAAGPFALLQTVRTAWIDYESVEPRDRLGLPFLDADTRAALRRLARVLRG
jgi:molybdopterin-guanine dinucleotide biosynthesis protein A